MGKYKKNQTISISINYTLPQSHIKITTHRENGAKAKCATEIEHIGCCNDSWPLSVNNLTKITNL